MEMNMVDTAEWLFEGEQDFTFGAKAAPYLHPATNQDAAISSKATFELPDWMETRDNLGLANIELFDDVMLPNNFDEIPSAPHGMVSSMEEEDYSTAIRPEDMLVPLSELQPQVETPKALSANPTPQPPRITINVKRVIVPSAASNNAIVANLETPQTSNITPLVPVAPSQIVQHDHTDNGDSSLSDADDLLDELVKMVGNEPKLDDFDTSMVDANIQDLLSQLEKPDDSQLDISDVSVWGSEPASPVSLPSPVPSCGSLSPPQSNGDGSFLSMFSPKSEKPVASPSYSTSEVAWSPAEPSFISPDPHILTIDKSALLVEEAPSTDTDWSSSELHSYSRSSSKKRSRKSNARVGPYPETKRERKKEQNKQAALRYRQKKKQEDDVIIAQMEAEEQRQKELQAKYLSLKQELTCMKKIMREVFIAKGVISADAFKKKK